MDLLTRDGDTDTTLFFVVCELTWIQIHQKVKQKEKEKSISTKTLRVSDFIQ